MKILHLSLCMAIFILAFEPATFSQKVAKINVSSSVNPGKTKATLNLIDSSQSPIKKSVIDSLLRSRNLLINNLNVAFLQNPSDSGLLNQLKQGIADGFQKKIDSVGKEGQDQLKEGDGGTGCEKLKSFSDLLQEKNDEGGYDFILVDKKENPLNSFEMRQMNKELFKDKLTKAINGLCDEMDEEMKTLSAKIVDDLMKKDLYDRFLEASLNIRSNDVLAGKLNIFKTVKVSYDKLDSVRIRDSVIDGVSQKVPVRIKKRFFIDPPFTVYSIQVQFQDGFVENIKVMGKMEGIDSTLTFENSYPFPFSNKTNFQKLYKRKLYEVTVLKRNSAYMYLGALIRYDYDLNLYTRDYFPENQVYRGTINDSIITVNLYREKTSRILAVRVFSDLKGVNTENPNGLIQTELYRSFNLWTHRIDLGRGLNIGFLNYYLPAFELNKVEDKRKELVLDHYEKVPATAPKANAFASSLDLYQHQIYSVGVGLNFLLIDLPNLKSTFNFCGGIYFGRSSVQDTVREYDAGTNRWAAIKDNNVTDSGYNTLQVTPEVKWQIFPDERFGVVLGYKFRYFDVLQSDFQQVRNKEHYTSFVQNSAAGTKYEFKKWLCTAEIFAFFKPSPTNELFFRYRLNHDLGNIRHNFSQLQIGLTTYLTSTKKK